MEHKQLNAPQQATQAPKLLDRLRARLQAQGYGLDASRLRTSHSVLPPWYAAR